MFAYCCYALLSLRTLSTNVEYMFMAKAYLDKYFRILILLHSFSFSFVLVLDAERKLAFLGKRGFDIFGNNALFTPLVKWEALQNNVNGIKEAAKIYENAFNDILEQVTNNENFEEVGGQVTAIFPPLLSSCVN